MLRIGALIKSYHSTLFLPIVLKLLEWTDKIVVMNYRFKTVEPVTDNTLEVCNSFGHRNLIIDSGEGLEQHEIYNRGLTLLKDCDLAWVLDADEIILPDDQNIILNRMCDRRPLCGLADYATCKIIDYNNDLYHASPQRDGNVLVMVAPLRVRFTNLRSIGQNNREARMTHATLHHLGLVDKDIVKWKSGWEYKEENHSKERLLSDWGIRREVTPPATLIDLFNANNRKSTWGFRIEKVPYKEQE